MFKLNALSDHLELLKELVNEDFLVILVAELPPEPLVHLVIAKLESTMLH